MNKPDKIDDKAKPPVSGESHPQHLHETAPCAYETPE
jgi:hypothetical protein